MCLGFCLVQTFELSYWTELSAYNWKEYANITP